MDAAAQRGSNDWLDFAKKTIRHEAAARVQLDSQFLFALDRIDRCGVSVLVTGMEKADLIGRKISATFCSIGTRSFFLHSEEAIHGDVRCVRNGDSIDSRHPKPLLRFPSPNEESSS